MNALGGRGMYPWDLLLPGGTRRLAWVLSGFSEGGKSASEGDGGKGVSSSMAGSGSMKVPGVTFGAKTTVLGEERGDETMP